MSDSKDKKPVEHSNSQSPDGKPETQTQEPNIPKPLKNPLLNRSKKERKYFDSADWAMNQGQEKKQ